MDLACNWLAVFLVILVSALVFQRISELVILAIALSFLSQFSNLDASDQNIGVISSWVSFGVAIAHMFAAAAWPGVRDMCILGQCSSVWCRNFGPPR